MGRIAPPVFVVLWSSAFVAAVIGTDVAPPMLLTFSRFALAGVLLAVIAWVSGSRWPRGRQLAHVVVVGLLMQGVQFGGFYSAIGLGLPGGVVALVQGLNPVVIALLAAGVLHERMTRYQWLGFAVGGGGVLLAVSDRLDSSLGAILLCVVGLLGLSLGTVYQKAFTPDVDVRSSTAVHFLVATPFMGVATLLLETPHVSDWGVFGGVLAWIVLVNSVGTFLLLNLMLRRETAGRVGALFFLTPAVTALLAWLVLGQTLSAVALVGLALGGVGVLIATVVRPPASTAGAGRARPATPVPAPLR
ncbi:DMT family transporter [Umezawaea sp.]|uniref:DMT family transporter n=1 Tax=Umezawaea sp. TaxID=1955258 RepID=UPI002ED37670